MVYFALLLFCVAWYYFVLRRFNSLGFRLFSVFAFASIGVLWWWLGDYRELDRLNHTGVVAQAEVLDLGSTGSNHRVSARFTDRQGKSVTRSQDGAISDQEFAALRVGGQVEVIYDPGSELFYLKPSFDRWSHDHPYVLIFPGVLLLLGILSWIFLRRFKVHARDNGEEFVVDEKGRVVLDDAGTS